jgi:DsbC/DsbD-like thiol-disulfide interchange protein
MLTAAQELTQGELSARGYAAKGGIKLEVSQLVDSRLVLRLEIPEGWHINSNHPLQDGLIATKLALKEESRWWDLEDVSYPKADTKRLGFQSDPLSLYQGVVEIQADFRRIDDRARILPLQLGLQACNDRVCLPPEKVYLRLPISRVGSR